MARSLVCLADLLTALDSLNASERPAVAKAFGLGYMHVPDAKRSDQDKAEEASLAQTATAAPSSAPPPASPPPPQTAPHFWRLASQMTVPQDHPMAPAWLREQSLGDATFYLPAPALASPTSHPVVPRARFSRFMKESLSVQRRSGEPDVQRLAQVLARRQVLSCLPQRRLAKWPAQVRAVVDGAEGLRPFQHDVSGLLSQMRRQLGSRLQVLAVNGEPHSGSGDSAKALPADATPTLVLSDAGALSRRAAVAARWSQAARRLQQAGHTPVLLTPVDPWPMAVDVAHWQVRQLDGCGGLHRRAAKVRSARPASPDKRDGAALDALAPSARCLRATLFGHSYVTPPLLRGLRRLLLRNGLGGGLGDELAVWHDEAVYANANACAVLSSHREAVREDFLQLPVVVQADVVALHLDHLVHQSPLVRAEYVRHLSAAWSDDGPLGERLAAELKAADALAARAAAWLLAGTDEGVAQDLAEYLARLGSRSGELLGTSEPLRTAWALAQQEALRAGDLDLPEGVLSEQIGWVLGVDFPHTHRLRLESARNDSGQAVSRLVYEREGATLPGGVDLAARIPGAPYLRLSPIGLDDPLRVLTRVISWWHRARATGAFAAFKLNMDDAWARPAMTQLQQLKGDPERVALEWLAWWRATQPKKEKGHLPGIRGEQGAAALAMLLWRQLPADWLRDQGMALPDERRERRHLRQTQTAPLNPDWSYDVRVGDQQLTLESVQRPQWADKVWCSSRQLWARSVDGREFVWMPRAQWPAEVSDGTRATYTLPHGFWWDYAEAEHFWFSQSKRLWRPSWASQCGVDEYGYWAEFELPSYLEQRTAPRPDEPFAPLITQRMRFIPPGRFWMGSPQAEAGRLASETLHPVTLTRGFWIANTACTQDLWKAVLGSLPEGQLALGDDLPVVNVSYDDIQQRFLPALNRLVPGLEVRLPAEAEWEYAARAGTTTTFPWGDDQEAIHMNFVGFELQGAANLSQCKVS